MIDNVFLEVSVPIALGVIGLINVYVGLRKVSNVNGKSVERKWYTQPYVLLGLSSLLLAGVLLLNDIRIALIPASNKTMQFLFFGMEGIVLVVIGICLFSVYRARKT